MGLREGGELLNRDNCVQDFYYKAEQRNAAVTDGFCCQEVKVLVTKVSVCRFPLFPSIPPSTSQTPAGCAIIQLNSVTTWK